MKMKSTIIACAACLMAGVAIGRLLPKAEQSGSGRTENQGTGERSGATLSALANPIAGGESSSGEAQDPSLDFGVADPTLDPDLVVVPASLLGQLSLATGKRSLAQNLFSGDGKVEETLQITDQEKAAVQTAWRGIQEGIRELESESSVPENLDDGSLRITLPDLTSDMAAPGSGFRTSVREILGENRGEVFLAMKQVDRILTPPAGERTYTVAAEPTGDGGWRFRMTLEGSDGRRVWVGDNIPNEIQHLAGAAQIVPDSDAAPEREIECE